MPETITQEQIKAMLRYNPETGEFFWIRQQPRRFLPLRRAGTRQKHGYRFIKIDGKRYGEHRLAWLYMYGEMPAGPIDHINRNPGDNRISNLRPSGPARNSQNQLGKGVSFRKGSGRWHARICVNRKHINLGFYDSEVEATAAYQYAKWHLHPSFRDSVSDTFATDKRQLLTDQQLDVLNTLIN